MRKGDRQLATNRRARHEYMVLDTFEAGMVLTGTEVKAIRDGNASLNGSYARCDGKKAVLHGMTIQPYEHGNRFNHDPDRPRRLLLHASELQRLHVQLDQKGCTLIPLDIHLRRGYIKVELGLCRGKKLHDKRDTLRKREATRDAAREIAKYK